ncbi:MAG: M67 family metallopeptidase [Rhodothermales bacterium]|nr:M67 family metallopeptidase [Rhodothermales bacterium]
MTIPEPVLHQLRRHAERAYPEECCGVLLGHFSEEIVALVPVENRDPEARTRRYLIGPDDYLRAEREAERRGLDVVGFYHSHPDHPARPSPADLAEATFPGFVYTITAVAAGRAEETTAWRLTDDRSRFVPVPLLSSEPA